MKPVLLCLGMKETELRAFEVDYSGNIYNVMFLCLRQWRRKTVDGRFHDIYRALESENANVHSLCKVSLMQE